MAEIKKIAERKMFGVILDMYGDILSPYFKARDICDLIESRNSSYTLKSIDESKKRKIPTVVNGRVCCPWFVTEQGMFDIIKQSNLPIAKGLVKEIEKLPAMKQVSMTNKEKSLKEDFSTEKAVQIEPIEYKQIKICVNGKEVVGIIKDGNAILPLTDLMKAVYDDKFQNEVNLTRVKISEFVIKMGTKKYISLMALPIILDNPYEKEILSSIISQTLNLPEISKDPVDVLYDGIVSMANVNGVIKQISDEIHKCDLRQSDLLHALENNIFSEKELAKVAHEIHLLRGERRDLKNRQTILDEQITELKNMGFKGSAVASQSVSNLAKLRAELVMEKKNKIYFNKDGSNRTEMEQKIQRLSA